ncbi:MAG: PilN domain-containing protein [Candidatus Omnitrophica bacterium]|nr:PilN domain-containing protein [Candidatus Omnitrophota bacterium]
MVQINLLPAQARKRKKAKIELQIKLGPILFVLVAFVLVIIVIWAGLGMRLTAGKKELARLDKQMGDLKLTLDNLDSLKKEKQLLVQRLEFMDRHFQRQVLWARNLNYLSRLIPSGIWLKNLNLSTVSEEGLTKYVQIDFNGTAVSIQGEDLLDLVGAFMSALKKDEIFSRQFSEIKLLSSQRSQSGKVETMDFKILCQFR